VTKDKREFGAKVTACTKLGIARSLITEANASLHNDKVRAAVQLLCDAIFEEEKEFTS
jgi:hypothetical protein